jgi:Xaa-Pro aminopeptidase
MPFLAASIPFGEMITLDFGAYYKGYSSDITRTFAIGEPDPQLKELYL